MAMRGSVGTQVMYWLVFLSFALLLALYVIWLRGDITKQFEVSLDQAASAYQSTQLRYRYITIPGDQQLVLAPDPYTYVSPTGLLTIVNKSNSLPLDYAPAKLITPPMPVHQNDTTIKIDDRIASPLKSLYDAARADGVGLFIRSAYRSADEQQTVYNESESGFAALAGQSEHQMGLAVDFNSDNALCSPASCALSQKAANWLQKNAAEYGFIKRYPADKVQITGYPAESWHYRYVGSTLAKAINKYNLSYEEIYSLFGAAKVRQ